jgi:hypothetical protein
MSVILAEVARRMSEEPAVSYSDFVKILEKKGLRRAETKTKGRATEQYFRDAKGKFVGILESYSDRNSFAAACATAERNAIDIAWKKAGLDPNLIF